MRGSILTPGMRTNEGVYILQNLAAARSLAKSMDQMIGDWSMVRGNGQAICTLVLTNTDAGNDNFQVFLKGKCDPAVASFNPAMRKTQPAARMPAVSHGCHGALPGR